MKNMKIIILFLLVTLFSCCTDSINNEIKNPRNFTWTSDTLDQSFQVTMRSIWGKSPNLVYVAGWSDDVDYHIYRYDGNQWQNVVYHSKSGGQMVGAVYLNTVFGFEHDDIWFGGFETYELNFSESADTAVIVHYDGFNWNRVPIINRVENGFRIFNIWGSSHNNVWFSGVNGEVYHWDGAEIKSEDLPVDVIIKPGSYTKNWVTGNSGTGTVYLKFENFHQSPLTVAAQILKKRQNGEWEILSDLDSGYDELWMSPSNTLWAIGGTLRYFDGANWQSNDFPHSAGIHGPSDEHLIVSDPDDHNVYYLKNLEGYEIQGISSDRISFRYNWYNGEEAFVMGHLDFHTVIFHGK